MALPGLRASLAQRLLIDLRKRGRTRGCRRAHRRLHDPSHAAPRHRFSRMTPNRSRSLSQSGSLQDPQDPLFRPPRIHLSAFEDTRRMSLPCLAFSRELLCVGAAAGHRPGRARRSGRDASAPPVSPPGAAQRPPPRLPRRLPRGRGSLASEMIPAGRLGGPERTAETPRNCQRLRCLVDRDGVHAVQARGVVHHPAGVVDSPPLPVNRLRASWGLRARARGSARTRSTGK